MTDPPPAPCASPDIHQMLYGDGPGLLSDDEEMEERVRQAEMKEAGRARQVSGIDACYFSIKHV